MKETEITVEVLEGFDSLKRKLIRLGFEMTEEVDMQDFYVSGKTMSELQESDYQSLINNSFLINTEEHKIVFCLKSIL